MLLVPANPKRYGVRITVVSANRVALSFVPPAPLDKGIVLLGGSATNYLDMTPATLVTNAIYAIADKASTVVAVQEYSNQ